MANSDKDILITPNTGASAEPTIEFTGADNTPITLRVLDDGTVSFEGTAGQLFSIADGLSGTIFSVNDISGIPSIEVLDDGTVKLAEYGGNVGVGKASPSTTLDVDGTVTATLFAGSGSALTNINWSSVDNKPDPTITLGGDASGSLTLTDLAGGTLTVTVSDDSHNHIISNIDGLQTALDAKAPLDSPALSGTPTAPTASASANSTQIATTAFVQTAVSNLINGAPGALDTLDELAAALGDDANFATTITNSLAGKQPLDADLTAIAALAGTSGFLKKTAANTWSLDTNTYLTGNQTITLSGDVSGSGTTAITVTVADDSHNHIISNVDGLQTALDAKLDSSSYTASDVLTKIKTVDGSTSGLDADLLDGQQASSFASLSGATFTGNVTGVSPTAAGSWGYRRITMSTSAPSGGLDGDVWLVYT